MIITCAKTNLPILGGPEWAGHPFSRVVLLREGRTLAAGWYDGAGRLSGLDLLAAGVRDEIEAGTACLVIGDSYRSGDAPSNLGRSGVMPEAGWRPSKEFIAACERLGGFATPEGLVLACAGKVAPHVGAALTLAQVAVLERLGAELRQAVATRLAALPIFNLRGSRREAGDLIERAVGLEIVPVDTELRTLRVMGGQGLEVGGAILQVDHERGTLSPSPDDLAADLVRWFPPRKTRIATLTRDGSPAGTLTRYDVPELATRLFATRSPEHGGVFGSLAAAAEALGLADDEMEELDQAMGTLRSSANIEVSFPARAGRCP
ncbi:hypothetical protein [Methylobacterium sp. 1030]|uniref:hypothetical protein n=1 Tax=Methylobacterium sp. 1030 TaxID=3156404 RepID=UPI003396CCA2